MCTPPHRNATAPARAHLQIASAARQFHPLQCIAQRIWAGESVQTRQPRATEKPEILYKNETSYAGLPTRFSAAKSDYFSLRSAPSFRDAAPQESLKSLTKMGRISVPESSTHTIKKWHRFWCQNLGTKIWPDSGIVYVLIYCGAIWANVCEKILAPKTVPTFYCMGAGFWHRNPSQFLTGFHRFL